MKFEELSDRAKLVALALAVASSMDVLSDVIPASKASLVADTLMKMIGMTPEEFAALAGDSDPEVRAQIEHLHKNVG